jgi:hypothetical protein
MNTGMNEKRDKKAVRLYVKAGDFIQAHSSKEFSRGIRLQTAWESIATPQVLTHTDNVVFAPKKDSTVLVYVENSHWAAELENQKELYRILLERETDWHIDEIKFLITKKISLKKLFIKKNNEDNTEGKRKIALPHTEKEDRYARELVSEIQDKELKERLYKAIKADFEWKKGRNALNLSQKPPESPETI